MMACDQHVILCSSGSRIWSRGGPNCSGGPTLKREGCTPDFIESYSLLGAKQRKMYALTLGLGGPGLRGPPGSATVMIGVTTMVVIMHTLIVGLYFPLPTTKPTRKPVHSCQRLTANNQCYWEPWDLF